MTNLEKVIKGLEICAGGTNSCAPCPFKDNCKGTSNAAMAAAIKLLKAQEAQGWVSVKDRLPDNKDRYLCACFDYVTKTYWIDILWHVSGSWWTRLSSMDTDKNANDHVRYWMPLTEPPKEDKDDDE